VIRTPQGYGRTDRRLAVAIGDIAYKRCRCRLKIHLQKDGKELLQAAWETTAIGIPATSALVVSAL